MRVSKELVEKNSEENLAHSLRILSDSGAGVIHIRTHEVVRAVLALRKAILLEGSSYHEWTIAHGFCEFDLSNMHNMANKGDGEIDITHALSKPVSDIGNAAAKPDKMHYYVYVNPHYWLEVNPLAHHHIQRACHILPSTNVRLILLTPDSPLPEALEDTVVTLNFDSPGYSELESSLNSILESVNDDSTKAISAPDKAKICYTGAGMSKDSFEMYTSLAIVNALNTKNTFTPDDIVSGVNKGKTEIVNKNDLLELYTPESMSNVGGMENLKEWILKRKDCYSDEAAEFGIEPPKGIVFVGIPGVGKSLAAKAMASVLGIPLVKLDFGRVFNSLVGKSEERIRTALAMVSSMAPVVCLVDEIDKGLGGIGGSGDSGTSHRVLGTFLTWLQDNKAPVFTMVTANNITGLPPELLRRGRFDAIFSAGLPTESERLEVLKIHLRKRGWEPSKFKDSDMRRVVNVSRGYVPAEIESAVKDALIDAFFADEKFTMDHVITALQNMVPLSKSFNEAIQLMTLWAKNNATPASKSYDELVDTTNVESIGSRRVRTRKED